MSQNRTAALSVAEHPDAAAAHEAAHYLCRHYTGAENGVEPADFQALRDAATAFAAQILRQPPSPERSLAVGKVREALSWGIAGLVMPRG